MSNVAEIASAAREVSAEKLGTAVQKAQVSILKMQIDTEAQIQLQLAAMLREMQPHLGSNVNIAV